MITTLNIKQLLDRWPKYSDLNILELANDGHFGLYFRPGIKRKTHNDAIKLIDDLIKKTTARIELPGYKEWLLYFEALKSKFLQLAIEKPFLFENKPGFERLVLPIEIEICGICATGSVEEMLRTTKIPYTEYNNTFGFFKNDDRYICNSYSLNQDGTSINILPRGYKRYLDIDDLFVFIDQIEHFEKLSHKKNNLTGKNKRHFLTVKNFDINQVVEIFINNKEADLYVYVSQLRGVATYKDKKETESILPLIDVTGYCKLTNEFKDWAVFNSEDGKIVLSSRALEIVEPKTIFPDEWNEKKESNFFRPITYSSKEEPLNKSYSLFPSWTSNDGSRSYCYALDQLQLLVDRDQLSIYANDVKRNRELLADGLGRSEVPLIAVTDDVDVSKKVIPNIANDISEHKQNKPKQKRAHALNELIAAAYVESEDKSPRGVWDNLRMLAKSGGHEILQEVNSWTNPTASIYWRTHLGRESKKIRSTFQNDIYKLNKDPSLK